MARLGLNIPPGQKLIGNNLALNARETAGVGIGRYEAIWNGTGWDWDGWIRPQLDYIIGDLGCNVVRSLGCHWGLTQGRVEMTSFLNRLVQVAGYLKDRGAYFYFNGDSHRVPAFTDGNEATRPIAETAPLYVTYLKELEQVGNSIGFDFMNEADSNGSGAYFQYAYMRDMIAFVKDAGVVLPLTYSVNGPTLTSGNSFINSNAVGCQFDFLDFHDYRYPYNLNFYANQDWDILVGETGVNSGAGVFDTNKGGGPSIAGPRMEAVYKMAMQTNPRIRGILHWAIGDQQSVAVHGVGAEEFGVYNTNAAGRLDQFVAREYLTRIIKSYTKGSIKHTNSL